MPEPVRTCIGCRVRAEQRELLRVVCRDGPLVDPRRVESGRGAYLHPRADCLDLALKRRAFGRAWRLEPGRGVDPEALRAAVAPYLGPPLGSAQQPTSR